MEDIRAERFGVIIESLTYRLHRHQIECDEAQVEKAVQLAASEVGLSSFELALLLYWLLRNGLKADAVYCLFSERLQAVLAEQER
jgi:hypothetical protein